MNDTIRHDKDGGFTVIPEKVTEGESCKCGNKTFTHRHTNWIECTSCNEIKVLQD